MADWYTFGVALFAAIGTFLFGFDTGIATTTIAHQSWINYMHHPNAGLTGAVVSVYIAGEAVGALTQTFVGDRLGRIRFVQMMCVVVTIGTVIQTAVINMGMFLAGRVLAGYAVGGLVGTVPIYLSVAVAFLFFIQGQLSFSTSTSTLSFSISIYSISFHSSSSTSPFPFPSSLFA